MSKPIHYTQKYIANKHQFITVGSNDPMLIPSIVSQPNTTVMTILPSGNVGIGTTVPRQLLDIQGGTSIFSGNIGIGTTVPRQLLDIQGGTSIFSGNIGIGTTDPQAKLHVNGTISQFGFPCMFIRNIYEEYDATNRTFSTTFADGMTWTSRSYNANSKLILQVYIPCRNDSTSWGGGYHEVQYNINNTGWLSFGNSGYTSVMSSAGGDIGTYSTVLYMPLTINTTFTCQFKYRHRSFDGTLYVNQSTDVVVGSTNSYGINVNQFYTKLLIVEVGG